MVRRTVVGDVARSKCAQDGERPADCAAASQDGVPLVCGKGSGSLHHGGDGDE